MSIARKLARGGELPVSPLIPRADILQLVVREDGRSPHPRQQLEVHIRTEVGR